MPMNSLRLQKHVYATYARLRFGLALLAALFPVVLVAGGLLVYDIPPRNTMSDYYFAAPPGGGEPPMRVWFVGLLFAISMFLILYRGFSLREHLLLSLAGVLGIGVAVFPMPWGCEPACPTLNLHRLSAVLFFACLAYVSVRCGRETLYLLKDERLRAIYRRRYRLIGAIMLSTPIVSLALSSVTTGLGMYVYIFETVGIWAFALYWWTKSRELHLSGAELLAIQGQLSIEPQPPRK